MPACSETFLSPLTAWFHSVSDGSGAFSLSTLPPGEYVIEAWHERYGTQTQTVTVTTGQPADVPFTFSG